LLAGVLGSLGEADGGPGGGATADAAHQAFLAGEASRGLQGVFIPYRNDLVDDVQVEHLGDKPRTDALNCVFAGLERGAGQAGRAMNAVRLLGEPIATWKHYFIGAD